MNKIVLIIITSFLIISFFTRCGKEKESPMVDMDNIKSDGSHDDKFIFRKEIEKEKSRQNRYKKNKFE